MKTGIFFAAKAAILSAAGVLCAASYALAADIATPLPMSVRTDTQASARVQTKLAGQFSDFAGSESNAQSLITGLRQGQPITLAAPEASGQTSPPLTIDTPTKPMGYGNVTISLALARQQLANLGITQPTPQQIQAALTGGTVTTGSGTTVRTVELPGILTMRGSGMGWGNIARSQGMNLGKVMSSARSPVLPPAAAAASGRGIVTATGAPADIRDERRFREAGDGAEHFERAERTSFGRAADARSAARNGSLSAAARPEAAHAMGQGIVTAAGTSVVATGAAESGRGRYSSTGLVTAGGGAAIARGQNAEISHGRH